MALILGSRFAIIPNSDTLGVAHDPQRLYNQPAASLASSPNATAYNTTENGQGRRDSRPQKARQEAAVRDMPILSRTSLNAP